MSELSKLDQKLIDMGIITHEQAQKAHSMKNNESLNDAYLAVATMPQTDKCPEHTSQKTNSQQQTTSLGNSSDTSKNTDLIQRAKELRVEYVDLTERSIDKETVLLIPKAMAERYQILCINKNERRIILAMANPIDVVAIDDIRIRTGFEVTPVYSDPADISRIINEYYGSTSQSMLNEVFNEAVESMDVIKEEEDSAKEVVIDAPVIRMVNQIIYEAVERRASDIHIEPFEKDLLVRFRIDGVLHNVMAPPKSILPALVSRIKIMSNLKIDERRLPQDGRIQINIKEKKKDLDIRVSTLPTLFGESVVMRLLDRSNLVVDLSMLGFSEADHVRFKSVISNPNGIILVTGPTGSGKSTTLYATLSALNVPDVKILTIEDPVEYYLRGINQVQANSRVGLNFATGLRSFLRQDPDIIMVGEIRDKETATIAIESALTGHLVLSTLHTNSAVGSITRLTDMGIEPFLITATAQGILAQRLVRKICDNCKEPLQEPPHEFMKVLKDLKWENIPMQLMKGKGCNICHDTGYKGRKGIYELLLMSDELRDLIISHATLKELEDAARRNGMHTLFEDGILKVLAGITTFNEVCRVTKQ